MRDLTVRHLRRSIALAFICSLASPPLVHAQAARTIPATLDSARQLVVVVTGDWNATTGRLRRFARTRAGAGWTRVGTAVPVVVGRSGVAWGDSALRRNAAEPVKREGDGRAPAGVFALDTAFGFRSRAELPRLRLAYAALEPRSDCVDDTSSVHYNTIVSRDGVPAVDWSSAEHMRSIEQYRIGVIIGYNAAPPRRGGGSCIFLHIWSGPASSTAGCTAMNAVALDSIVRWLDSSRRPVIVQLPAAAYEQLRVRWALPAA